jgi:predicted MPP superfamily phosphohydrolase
LKRATAAAVGAATAAAGAAAWTTLVEPRRLRVRKVKVEVPAWPETLAGLKIALVSDLHAGAPQVDERAVGRVVAAINRTRPDLIALLGDYIDPEVILGDPVEPEAVAERLAKLQAPLGVFAVLGNHDWMNDGERVRHALREQRIDVLENDATSVALADQPLWLVGLADASERDPDMSTPFSLVPGGAPLVVLSHNPDLFPLLPERPSLTLAGHTHGAQVNVPLVRDAVTPSDHGARFAGGLTREGERVMYVSRGIGTSRIPVRFRAAPEIVLLTVARSAQAT